MPLYSLCCTDDACDVRFEEFISLANYPYTPPCPKCGQPTFRDLRARTLHGPPPDPVVVYRAPDGSYRFPPAIDSSSSAFYAQKGFQRIELRGWQDVRRFETQFNAKEMSEVRRRVERQSERHEAAESARRSEIRRGLEQGFQVPELDSRGRPTGRTKTVRLSPRGRAIMAASQALKESERHPRVREIGFHVGAYSDDRTNRDRDPHRRDQ